MDVQRALILLVAVLAIASCGGRRGGRGGPLGDGGTVRVDSSSPPRDAAPTCTGVETCNRVDDDCDGIVDEGCMCSVAPGRLTTSPGLGARSAYLAFNGAELAMVWNSNFARQFGIVRGGSLAAQVPHEDNCDSWQRPPVWTGAEWIDAWASECGSRPLPPAAYLSRIGSDGNARSAPFEIGPGNLRFEVDWTGGELGVLTCAGRFDGTLDRFTARFERRASDGVLLAESVVLADEPGQCAGLALSWNGRQHLASWAIGRESMRFAVVDASGLVTGTGSHPIRGWGSALSDLVWTGVDWVRLMPSGSELVRIDASPSVTAVIPLFTDGDEQVLEVVWNGTDFGVLRQRARTPDGFYEVVFSLVSAAGVPLGDPVVVHQVNSGGQQMASATLSVIPGGFAMAWTDRRHEQPEIYFSEARCPW